MLMMAQYHHRYHHCHWCTHHHDHHDHHHHHDHDQAGHLVIGMMSPLPPTSCAEQTRSVRFDRFAQTPTDHPNSRQFRSFFSSSKAWCHPSKVQWQTDRRSFSFETNWDLDHPNYLLTITSHQAISKLFVHVWHLVLILNSVLDACETLMQSGQNKHTRHGYFWLDDLRLWRCSTWNCSRCFHQFGLYQTRR